MDNAAKALEIAAGVLLGVLLFAAVAYFFSSIGGTPAEEDKTLSAEQLAKFNLEYEVYNKNKMYGVDVISCLNKVKSNDDKYVAGNGFMTGQAYGSKYIIDVSITMTNELEEHLRIYRIKNGKSESILGKYTESLVGKYNPLMGDDALKFKFPKNSEYTSYQATKTIFENYNDIDVNGKNTHDFLVGTHTLVKSKGDNPTYNDEIKNLLDFSDDNMRQVRYNTSGKDLDVWSSVEWETTLYYFKKKKFKCDKITYSPETGRVNCIYFSEI